MKNMEHYGSINTMNSLTASTVSLLKLLFDIVNWGQTWKTYTGYNQVAGKANFDGQQ